MTAPVLELSTLSDDELAALYRAGGEATQAAVLAHCGERDAQAERTRCARERRAAKVADWESGAYAQYLAAEAATNGYLLSREGLGAGIDPWPALWRGAETTALRYASEELREFWLANPRVTVTGYLAQASDRRPDPTAPDGPEPEPAVPAGPPPPPPSAVLREAFAATRARRAVVMAAAMQQAGDAVGVVVAPAPAGLTKRPAGELVPVERPVIDGAELLGYTRAFLARFCQFPSEAALDTVVLWVAACHATDPDGVLVWEATGRLMFLSSEPGSGKSRALSLVAMLTGSSFGLLAEPTAAAIAGIIGEHHEIAACDEADILFGAGRRKESVRALLNAGYLRGACMPAMHGSKVNARKCFGPVALAGLDSMATDTSDRLRPLFTRSFIIRMIAAKAKLPAPGRPGREMAGKMHQALTMWCAGIRDELTSAEPEVPEHLVDRDLEIWLPLLAVAEAAGGPWPQRAWRACEVLTQSFGGAGDDETAGLMDDLAEMAGQWA